MGWVGEATPVTNHPALAAHFGARSFSAKRDDITTPFAGSSKTRKLDYLLALPKYKSAETWASVGAIGSGSLVAIASAAEHLNKKMHAYMFWEEMSARVANNLGYTAARAEQVFFSPNRVALGLRYPGIVAGVSLGGTAVIPAGATTPWSTLGIVRAGLELAEDIRQKKVPAPDIVVCPHGTGGMVAGLSVGLGLAGLSCTLLAVSAVERIFSPVVRVKWLTRSVVSILLEQGVFVPKNFQSAPVQFDFCEVGAGYGRATEGSRVAAQLLQSEGIAGEPVYAGKALSGLSKLALENKDVLFWVTPRSEPDSVRIPKHIPVALARRIASY